MMGLKEGVRYINATIFQVKVLLKKFHMNKTSFGFEANAKFLKEKRKKT